MQDDLQHGPWPWDTVRAGVWQPLAAYSSLRPVPGKAWKPWFDAAQGAATPWHATSRVAFDGQVDSVLTLQPVRLADGAIEFSGGTLNLHHTPQLRQTMVSGQAALFKVFDADTESQMQMHGIHFDSRTTGSRDTDLQSSQQLQLDSLQISGPDAPPVRLDKPNAQADIARTGSLLDARIQYKLGTLFVDEQDLGVIQLKASAQQLDIDAVQALLLDLDQIQADGDGLDALGAADQQRLQALLLPVLAPAPVLALDSLSWVTPKGKTDLQIRAEFRPVDDAGDSDIGALLERGIQKLALSAGVSKPMLMAVLSQAQSGNEGAFGAALFGMLFDQYADRLSQAELVREQDGQIRSDISYAEGRVTVNGRSMTPMELMQQFDEAVQLH